MIKAYAVVEAGSKFQEFEYDPGVLGPHDVEIEVKSCGICHSDLSMWKNHWGITSFPFVGGHEVAGIVSTNYWGTGNQCKGWRKSRSRLA